MLSFAYAVNRSASGGQKSAVGRVLCVCFWNLPVRTGTRDQTIAAENETEIKQAGER
jgi:hypothetical protein